MIGFKAHLYLRPAALMLIKNRELIQCKEPRFSCLDILDKFSAKWLTQHNEFI